eukprot:1880508-Amphidinium_carterae.2
MQTMTAGCCGRSSRKGRHSGGMIFKSFTCVSTLGRCIERYMSEAFYNWPLLLVPPPPGQCLWDVNFIIRVGQVVAAWTQQQHIGQTQQGLQKRDPNYSK